MYSNWKSIPSNCRFGIIVFRKKNKNYWCIICLTKKKKTFRLTELSVASKAFALPSVVSELDVPFGCCSNAPGADLLRGGVSLLEDAAWFWRLARWLESNTSWIWMDWKKREKNMVLFYEIYIYYLTFDVNGAAISWLTCALYEIIVWL